MRKLLLIMLIVIIAGLSLNSVSALTVSMKKVSTVTINNQKYDLYTSDDVSVGIKETVNAKTCSGYFTGELYDVDVRGAKALFKVKIGNYPETTIELRSEQFAVLYPKYGDLAYMIFNYPNVKKAMQFFVQNDGVIIIYSKTVFIGVHNNGAIDFKLMCLVKESGNGGSNNGGNGNGGSGTQTNSGDVSELKKAWLQWMNELSPGYDKVFDQKSMLYSEPYILVYKANEVYSSFRLSNNVYKELVKTSLDATVYIYSNSKTGFTPEKVDVVFMGVVLPQKYYQCSCKTVKPYTEAYSSSTVSALDTLSVTVHIPYEDMKKLVEQRPDLRKSYNDYQKLFALIKSAYLKGDDAQKNAIAEFYRSIVNPSFYVLYTLKYPYMFVVIHTSINNQKVNLIVPVYIRSNSIYYWMMST